MPRASLIGVVHAGVADVAEDGDHADDGADETEEGGDADDDFEDDEAAFEADDFVAGAGLEGVGVVGLGPGEVVGGVEERRLRADGCWRQVWRRCGDVLGGAASGDGGLDFGGHDLAPAEDEAAFHDEGEADDGGEDEQAVDQQFHDVPVGVSGSGGGGHVQYKNVNWTWRVSPNISRMSLGQRPNGAGSSTALRQSRASTLPTVDSTSFMSVTRPS